MLWRTSYETTEIEATTLEGLPLPEVGEGTFAAVISFSPRHFQQREVWRRLFEAELAIPYFVGVIGSADDLEQLQSSTPRSQHERLIRIEDAQGAWLSLLGEENKESAFAFVQREGTLVVLMVGPPTEEAWDRFLDSAR